MPRTTTALPVSLVLGLSVLACAGDTREAPDPPVVAPTSAPGTVQGMMPLAVGHRWDFAVVQQTRGAPLVAGQTLGDTGAALIEADSVMARLPPPCRLAASDTRRLLASSFRKTAKVPALSGPDAWKLLDMAVSANIDSAKIDCGAVYGAQILARAKEAALRTWRPSTGGSSRASTWGR